MNVKVIHLGIYVHLTHSKLIVVSIYLHRVATTMFLAMDVVEIHELAPEPEPEQIATTADNKYRIVGFQMGKFYVVHGSFASETDCEKHIRIAGFDKYNPMIVKQSGNSHLRVCLGVFSTEAEAQEFIDRHQLKAWILKE